MYLSGHVHGFERSLPVLDNVPYFNDGVDGGGDGVDGGDDVVGGGGGGGNDAARRSSPSVVASSSKMVYEDPVAPVHIVNGAGGCLEVSASGELAQPTALVAAPACSSNRGGGGGGIVNGDTLTIAWCRCETMQGERLQRTYQEVITFY